MDCEKKHKQIEGVTLNQNHRDGKDMCTWERASFVFCFMHVLFLDRICTMILTLGCFVVWREPNEFDCGSQVGKKRLE